jgi:F0F1-type ATP synthase assembly protein I
MSESKEPKPKYGKVVDGLEQLSLGVSIVVAILIGVGLGILMRDYFGYGWLFWLGVFWGVAAAGLNIKKAYQKQKAELDKLKDDPRYKHYNQKDDDDDEDEGY